MEELVEIEKREIRGVSVKTLYGLAIGIATVVITVMGTYSSLSGQIKDSIKDRVSDAKLIELRQQIIQEDIKLIKLQIKDLETKLDNKTQNK